MMISATNPVDTGDEAKRSAEQQHQQQQQQEDTNASSQLQQDQQVDEQQHSMPSMPWTIGATEGNIPVSPPPSPGLLDQLGGLLRGTPSPPPFVSTPKNGAVIGQATSPPPTPTTPKQPNLQSLSSKQQNQQQQQHQPQQQQQQQHEHWKFQSTATSVESVLGAACHVMGFDIAEVWLRTGPKTHQLINSHLRPTALEDTVREDLVSVYYGERASERTHRLSPALCKRAKEANDVVWVTAQTDESALRLSISDVRTAVAIPVCHQPTHTNLTVIFFSIKRTLMKPQAVEFLVHMSLAVAVSSVNTLQDETSTKRPSTESVAATTKTTGGGGLSQSEHTPSKQQPKRSNSHKKPSSSSSKKAGPNLHLQWKELRKVEYLTDGGTSWIHTAILNGRSVVVKTLKPECQDVALAINEIESELAIHARLSHDNVVDLVGAGITSKGVRFLVLERLDGGTLSQMMGYDTRIRDRRRRFWRRKTIAYVNVLQYASSIAAAMAYCQEQAVPDGIVMHRDLKPDNIGFTLNGTVKILDFGLARIIENMTAQSKDLFEMSGETGSLRYMAPEVAAAKPYNHKADVYSFGMILWELNAGRKPFEGLNRNDFYQRVVDDGERPPLGKKWPHGLCGLITDCWNTDSSKRPTFGDIVRRLQLMLKEEKGGSAQKRKSFRRRSGIIDRHSTWF